MNGHSLWNRLLSQFRRWRNVRTTFMSYSSPSDVLFHHSSVALFHHPGQQMRGFRNNIEYRPKSLPDYDCSAILCGEVGPENYSSDCWLEEHLHRFSSFTAGQRNTTNSLDESSSSYGVGETISNFSGHSFTNSDASSWLCLYHYGQTDELMGVESPPACCDEPPPTYEEAMRSQDIESESSSCSLTHVDHASDWMW